MSITYADDVLDGEECRLYMVLFVFVDADRTDAPLRFEHGIASGSDEDDALTNAMATVGENHRGETLFESHAREVTETEAESLFEMVVRRRRLRRRQ